MSADRPATRPFPERFLWGAATSAYQIEGAAREARPATDAEPRLDDHEEIERIGGELRPGIVHRIDKDTTGLMVAAKTEKAHTSLGKQFAAHAIVRERHPDALLILVPRHPHPLGRGGRGPERGYQEAR